MEKEPQYPQVPEQQTQQQLEENKGFGEMPEGEAMPQKRPFRKEPLGQVLSRPYRVKRISDGKLGKIEKVVTDGRSWVNWDDGTQPSLERPNDLTVVR